MTLSILKSTLQNLKTGRPLSRSSKEWLVDGFERFLRDGQLEKDLGLTIPGSYFFQPATVELYAQRNKLIKELASIQPGSNSWQKAKRLESILGQYPDHRSELLDQLFNCGVGVPKSAKQIQRVLNGENTPDRIL